MNEESGVFGTIIDKVVISVLATAVSTFVFFGYTAYTKALDSVQNETRGISQVAFDLRDLVLKNIATVTADIDLAYLNGTSSRLDDRHHKAALIIAERINLDSKILSSSLAESSKSGSEIAGVLKAHIYIFNHDGFPAEGLDKFHSDLADKQLEFIKNFNSEVGKASAKEFGEFFSAFLDAIPPEVRPINIGIAAVVILLALVALRGLLRHLSSSDSRLLKQ